MSAAAAKTMDTLGVYISVPFCRQKCTYCNFASGVFPAALHEPYGKRLCAEIRNLRVWAEGRGGLVPEVVDSVYWGGGTPSELSGKLINEIWRTIRGEFAVAKSAEITMECAPGQLAEPSLSAMLQNGLSRVSLGVQSFVDREAKASGRRHTKEVALAEIDRIRKAGVSRVNVDLIAGLPYQNRSTWMESLRVLTGSGVDHASIYILELDEESRLGRETIAGGKRYSADCVPGDDLTAEFYETAVGWLEEHGIRRYEISNFARPGSESRHNRKYWLRQPYAGFGLDAHSMLRVEDGAALRMSNSSDLAEYLAGDRDPVASNALTPEEEFSEALFLGLRLSSGVSWSRLTEQFGTSRVEPLRPIVDELSRDGLLDEREGSIRLTGRGVLLSNEVFVHFV